MMILDLNKLPVNAISPLEYNPIVEFPELNNLGEISERIDGCAKFNRLSSSKDLSERAQFSATLNEFVSISERLKKDHENISIEKLDYPLFHFIKELRVTDFHLKTLTRTESTIKITFVSGKTSMPLFEYRILIIDNCNIDLFRGNKNYTRHYATKEFQTTVRLVNQMQRVSGINRIIEIALRQYCELIKNTVIPVVDFPPR